MRNEYEMNNMYNKMEIENRFRTTKTDPKANQWESPFSTNILLELLPKSMRIKYEQEDDEKTLVKCIESLHLHSKPEELQPFLSEIGTNWQLLQSKPTPEEKVNYIYECIDRNIDEGIKKISTQVNNYITALNNSKA